jgi:hypothetical protein
MVLYSALSVGTQVTYNGVNGTVTNTRRLNRNAIEVEYVDGKRECYIGKNMDSVLATMTLQ